MFYGESQPGRYSNNRHTPDCWSFHVTVESVNAGEHKTGKPRVGCDKCSMGQQVWLERQEYEGNKSCACSEDLPSSHEHQKGQQQGKCCRCDTSAEEDLVRVVLIEEILATQKCVFFKVAVL